MAEWQTPNDPDGVELTAAPYWTYDGRCVWQVQWIDPDTGIWQVMGTAETERERALQWGRYVLWRAYGDRVIKPEHRGDEF